MRRVPHVAPLHNRPTGKSCPPLPVTPPVYQRRSPSYQPQEGIHKIYPNTILHSLDIVVALGVFFDVHLYRNSLGIRNRQDVGGVAWCRRTFPKVPNKAIQRMKRMKFHTKVKANRRMKGTKYSRAVKAEKPATTSAKT